MDNLVSVTAKTGVYVGKVLESGVEQFLGIRYAKPARRWERAELPEPSSKRYLALNDNPACPQDVPVEEYPEGEPPQSEDCLYLNVWTSGTETKKPVYIFIHGGSYVTGSCRTDCFGGVYCGDRFVAEYPDVVYVNIEYRIGAFGSMDLSRFEGAERYAGSVNLQIHDQATAIKWVYENIGAFGGDPEQITIGGQSAGSYSVYVLMGIPEVAGMIKGVIAESTAVTNAVIRDDKASAERGFTAFWELAGCKTLEEALALPVERIVECSAKAKATPGCMALFGPVCDDSDLVSDLEGVWESGACEHIAVMTGTVAGEFATDVMYQTPEEIAVQLKQMFPALADEDIEACRANYPGRDPHEAMEDLFNDLLIRAAQSKAADSIVKGGGRVWAYYVDMKPKGGSLRAQHCYELPYIADKLDGGLFLDASSRQTLLGDEPDAEFGKKIRAAWHNFITTRDPNGEELGLEWPSYSHGRTVMSMGPEWRADGEVRPADLEIARKYN